MNDIEKEKLLVQMVPNRYFECLDLHFQIDEFHYEHQPDYYTMGKVSKFYKAIYNSSPESLKKKAALRFARVIREGSETEVVENIKSFLTIDYFKYFEPDDEPMIKQHLIDQIPEKLDEAVAESCRGLSSYLTDEELRSLTDRLIGKILFGAKTLSATASSFLDYEYSELTDERKKIIKNAIEKRKQWTTDENCKSLKELQEYLDLDDELPF